MIVVAVFNVVCRCWWVCTAGRVLCLPLRETDCSVIAVAFPKPRGILLGWPKCVPYCVVHRVVIQCWCKRSNEWHYMCAVPRTHTVSAAALTTFCLLQRGILTFGS
jgi:hypothetical protein